jgi:fructokinase
VTATPHSTAGTCRIGIDLGGTKIAGIALDGTGATLAEYRTASPRADYGATIAAIGAVVQHLEQAAGRQGSIGIGMPGSVSPATGRVQNANSTWLNGRDLKADLEAHLGRPVRLANDANCFALSEATDGAAAGVPSVFGVIIGTGCGGGIVINGRLIDGPRGIGGEWGHNPLPWAEPSEHPGQTCWCGRPGCLETWVSGTGMAADHTRVTGIELTGPAIADAAAAGDAAARATLARHASRLARGLSHVVNLIDPHVIVLGGGLSQMAGLYTALPPLMAHYVLADVAHVDIRPPKWGDASGVRGAAWLWEG